MRKQAARTRAETMLFESDRLLLDEMTTRHTQATARAGALSGKSSR